MDSADGRNGEAQIAGAAGHGRDRWQDVADVLDLFGRVADRTAEVLGETQDWSPSGRRAGQYRVDVALDRVCVDLLHGAGFVVLSEESGVTAPDGSPVEIDDHDALVVVDPLDGSTNAALGLPWCATALCLVVGGVPRAALVANLRTGERFEAVRGGGSRRNGVPIRVSPPPALAEAIIAVNARAPESFAPRQYRSLGATALDIASVGLPGGLDGTVDFDDDRVAVWDYLASVLVVEEAGGVAADALGRDLVTLDPAARRRPVTAKGPALLDELLAVAE